MDAKTGERWGKVVKLYKIPSFTNPNREYAVRQFDSGEWHCNCLHFLMREKKIKQTGCKHIKQAKRNARKSKNKQG